MENSKKRKINFFDVVFILLILVAGVVAYMLVHGEETVQETRTRTYMVELTNIDEGMEKSVNVGDAVRDNIKNYDVGTVKEIEVLPYTLAVTDETQGVTRDVEIPGKVSLHVTIEVETTETASSVQTASGYDLKTGGSASLSLGTLRASGYILYVER